ncbi:15891_t:CDS:1, partial [Gigaspora rosea]
TVFQCTTQNRLTNSKIVHIFEHRNLGLYLELSVLKETMQQIRYGFRVFR